MYKKLIFLIRNTCDHIRLDTDHDGHIYIPVIVAEVNKAAEVVRPEISLLRTSESSFSFILIFFETIFFGKIMKYHVEF